MKPDKRKQREREKREARLRAQRTPVQVANEKAVRRQCGDCQACCAVLAIPTLDKPRTQRCPNQCAAGCAIYSARPPECAGYLCLWRQGWGGERDRPDKLGAVIDLDVNPAFAKVAGARGASVKVKDEDGKSKRGGVIRMSLVDESKHLSPELRAHVDQLVRVGEVVTLVYQDRIDLYGPKYPAGLTFTKAELDRINAEISARKETKESA